MQKLYNLLIVFQNSYHYVFFLTCETVRHRRSVYQIPKQIWEKYA